MNIRERDVVRALIVSPDSSLLLIKINLPEKSVWITPGGGIEGTEDACLALNRELKEEIGRSNWDFGPAVWFRSNRFDYDGETRIQHETFYWIESEYFEAPSEMPDEHERKIFGGFKWWTPEELCASNENFAPSRLSFYFSEIISAGLPDSIINVGK